MIINVDETGRSISTTLKLGGAQEWAYIEEKKIMARVQVKMWKLPLLGLLDI